MGKARPCCEYFGNLRNSSFIHGVLVPRVVLYIKSVSIRPAHEEVQTGPARFYQTSTLGVGAEIQSATEPERSIGHSAQALPCLEAPRSSGAGAGEGDVKARAGSALSWLSHRHSKACLRVEPSPETRW